MAKLAQMMFPALWNDSTTVMDVFAAYKKGSPEARKVFETAGVHLGRGFAFIADFLNPERIILGGLGFRIGEAFLPVAENVFQQETLSQASRACKIVPSQLKESIGDVASLCAALDQGGMRRE
jgi:glucokinase